MLMLRQSQPSQWDGHWHWVNPIWLDWTQSTTYAGSANAIHLSKEAQAFRSAARAPLSVETSISEHLPND